MDIANSEDQFASLLQKHGLKKTRTRLSILNILKSGKAAMSQPELEKMMGEEADSVTLYRSLKTFEESGILHKVIDINGTANYALCSDNSCTPAGHHDQHLHFNCTVCLKVYCLEHFHSPAVNVPVNFTLNALTLTAYGVCSDCNSVTC